MDEMENKLGAILGNPEMMEKIMSLAQSFEAGPSPSSSPAPPPAPPSGKPEAVFTGFPELDIGTIQKLSGLMGKSNIDKNQQTLLHALTPYLSQMRIQKLERAMRAARMATMAGSLFGSGLLFPGR